MAETFPKPDNHSDLPDEQELLAALTEQMADPYLSRLYEKARGFASRITCEELGREAWHALINELDADWPYLQMPIRVTGRVKAKYDGMSTVEARQQVDLECSSNGFTFLQEEIAFDDETFAGSVRAGLSIIVGRPGEDRYSAFIDLDDIDDLEVPFPSDELRLQRFAYHFPKQSEHIDELAFTSRREDQIVKSYAEFYFDVNSGDIDAAEAVRDAIVCLSVKAELEPVLPYHIAFLGNVMVVMDNVNGIPTTLRRPHNGLVSIHQIILRPADVYSTQTTGLQRLVPFLDATLHGRMRGDVDKKLLIPCSSITWIESTRYTASSHEALMRAKSK
ncbi:MAG TPA: hypothetical protein PKV96_03215 [Candidatus Saccharimonas sp.]|nr:hypothetical protein [Candidatus Saccharimonas sp.]